MSNAKWLEKIIPYRDKYGIGLAKELIRQKIKYQFEVVGKKESREIYFEFLKNAESFKEILLIEARAAKEYWKFFGEKIKSKSRWFSRMPHHGDTVNKMLDIGYHFITQKTAKIFLENDIPAEIGLLHRAQSKDAQPLVYDFIEWLRPILVDRNLIKFLHKKKKFFEKIDDSSIPHFLNEINKFLKRRFYHKHLKYCVSLKYFIVLNALAMRSAVTKNQKPKFYFPSLRHENRCKKPPIRTVVHKKDI